MTTLDLCSIFDCNYPAKTRGMCAGHYGRWCRHGAAMAMTPIAAPVSHLCTVSDCLRPVEGHGYCVKHRYRARRHGDPSIVLVEQDPTVRFHASYVVTGSGCWEWQNSDTNQFGHGRFWADGERVGAHRWSYEHFVGPIPEGFVIDHLCRNPCCVNPEHLEPVTQEVNLLRASTAITTINANKTHCIRGHELSGANLIKAWNGHRPARQCRECRRIRDAEYRRQRRLQRAG
jgi:hypothetical protein